MNFVRVDFKLPYVSKGIVVPLNFCAGYLHMHVHFRSII